MNQKKTKKIRQLYHRNMTGLSQAFVNDVIKPKPKYFPSFIWWFLAGFFIKFYEERIDQNGQD